MPCIMISKVTGIINLEDLLKINQMSLKILSMRLGFKEIVYFEELKVSGI